MQKVWEFLWSGKIGHVSCLLLYVLGKDVDNSVRTIQGKVDRTDPVLIILCSTVVQYRSSTAHAESAERPVC